MIGYSHIRDSNTHSGDVNLELGLEPIHTIKLNLFMLFVDLLKLKFMYVNINVI